MITDEDAVPVPVDAPLLDKEVAVGHTIPDVDRGHIPAADGRMHDERDPQRPAYENSENRYGREWLDRKIQLKMHLNRDPYYFLARQVAGETGRTAEDLIEDPLQYAKPRQRPRKRAREPAPAPAHVPVPVPEPPEEVLSEEPSEYAGSPTKINQPIGANIDELRKYADTLVDLRWAKLPEHIGVVFFRENLQAAVDWALYEIYTRSGQRDVTLFDLVTNPVVQTAFFRLVAVTLRINELETPRRNDNPKVILPMLLRRRLALLLRFQKLTRDGDVWIFSDMPRNTVASRPLPAQFQVGYDPITEQMDRQALRTYTQEKEYDKNREIYYL